MQNALSKFEDMRQELEELDEELDELEALHIARSVASNGRSADILYEDDVLELKENIGELLEEINEADEQFEYNGASKSGVERQFRETLERIQSAYRLMRKQLVYHV